MIVRPLQLKRKARVAILDMYNNKPNQGLRCIRELLDERGDYIEWKEFNVRAKNEIPSVEDFDIFVSSGGPGNPKEGDGIWDKNYYDLLDRLWEYNQNSGLASKKYVFFICHSFQMACHHFGLASVTLRHCTSFGVLAIHKTPAGREDPILGELPDPFYAVESRDWQVVQPRLEEFEERGARILSLEDIHDKVSYERAIMAVRFSEEFFGTQFHPEADVNGLLAHYKDPDKRRQTIEMHGEETYREMLERLSDPDKVLLTHDTILPNFLDFALTALKIAG